MDPLSIDPAAPVPPFEQLKQQLAEQIMGRRLSAGERLPAVRALAAELSLAPGTVARAYKELETEGYLITRGRNGTLVAPVAAADDDTARRAEELTSRYVEGMREFGFGHDAIVGEVRRALG